MDLLAVQQAVEQACRDFQNPHTRLQGERVLVEFRNSSQALIASQHILQHSQDAQAQFQAVLALRHAALSSWAGLPQGSKQSVLSFLLQHTLQIAAAALPQQQDPYHQQQLLVQTQCAATVAALVKRGWEDMAVEERHTLMQGIDSAAAQAGTPHARRTSLQLLAAIVQEFSPATASPLGLPWDYHERCRASLESTYLQGLFIHALNIARDAAPGAATGTDEGGVCQASLGLLCTILSWDFSKAGGTGVWRLDETARPDEVMHVRPPPSWAELLLAPASFDWLEGLLQAIRGPQLASRPLAQASRQLLCLLCSLSGDSFPRQPHAEAGTAHAARAELGLRPSVPTGPEGAKDLHLLRVLRMLLPFVAPPAAAVHAAAAGDESELLDACRGLLAAAAVHRAPRFERAAAGLDPPLPGGILSLLSELTHAVLAAGGAGGSQYWSCQEAGDMLLEMWVELVADPCRGPVGSSQAAVSAAGAVFSALMEAALREAAASAHEDAEDEEGGEGAAAEEALDKAAAVARAAAPLALPLLTQQVQQAQHELAGCMRTGQDPSATLEQLCWLLTMSGHVLADGGEGETPLVPIAILEACAPPAWAQPPGGGGMGNGIGNGPVGQHAQQAQQLRQGEGGGGDSVVALGRALLGVGAMCLEEAARPVVSPRLMEVVVTVLGRWADTYLLPDEPASPSLEAAFGGGPGQARHAQHVQHGGPAVLEALVQLLLAALTRFPGETTLHEAACHKLLAPLARRWAVSRLLVASPAWASLTRAVGEGAPGVVGLAGKVQRRLVQGVCLAAEGLRGEAGVDGAMEGAAERYIADVLRYTVAQLQALGAEQDSALLQRADTLQRLSGLLESMRGAARGVLPHTQAAIFLQFTAVSQPLVALLAACCHHPAVVALILKLAAELAEGVVGALSASQAGALFAWALELLRVYASRNLGQISVQAGALQAERQAERYKDLRALLKLLTNLSHRDWSDTSALASAEARQSAGDDVAQVVFAGLDIILPLMSVDLLKFPKLGRQYFTLLAYMAEVYPERVATLPPRLFQVLLGTLRFGIGLSGDAEVTQSVFEAVSALAKFHAVALAGGRPGLGQNNDPTEPNSPSPLGQLMQSILHRLLQDDSGHEAADHAAEALLPLLLAEGAVLQAEGEAMIAGLPDQAAKEKVAQAFLQLTAGIERSLDRGNRQRFRANLLRFAGEVRGAVRVR